MLDKVKPAFGVLRDCKAIGVLRHYGWDFLRDQVDPVRGDARGRDYTLSRMLATRSVFVHVPKAAGVSISQAIYGNYGMGHLSIRGYRSVLRRSFLKSAFVFTFVRNPWDRLHSAYRFLKAGGWPGTGDAVFHAVIADCPSFEHFVHDWLERADIQAIEHFVPSLELLLDRDGEFFPFDFVGRYERLAEDFAELADLFGVARDLPHLNTMSQPDALGYARVYTPRMVDAVARHYAGSIAALGYTFDGYSDAVPALEQVRAQNPSKRPGKRSPLLRKYTPDLLAAP